MGVKIYALQNALKLCFELGIGENDALTLAYEVAPAEKTPLVTPRQMGTRVHPQGVNGEYRRRRASGRCAHSDRRFSLK